MSERVDYYEKKMNMRPDREQEHRRKSNAFQPLLIGLVLIVGIFLGTQLGKDAQLFDFQPNSGGDADKLLQVLERIEDNYVDSVDGDDLVERAIETLLDDLDPHSYYISPEDFSRMSEQMQGGFDGIGVEFMIEDDTLVVVNAIDGGPSQRAGIIAGDRIVLVDDSTITGADITSEDVMTRLKGRSGSSVKIGVQRPGKADLLSFDIERDRIPIYSVVAQYQDGDVGYVKINQFARTTYEEFRLAVDNLREGGTQKLVLDLRGNGGGYLDAATNIVEEFLDKNELIVFTEGRTQGKRNTYSSKRGKYREMEVTVLMNQSSASASEVVAGALQDHDRSITIGRRSFGKGLVQHQYEMRDNSALRITVARYYTPSGRCIQKPYGDGIDYEDDYHQRLESGELMSADSIEFADSLRFETPGGRIVYGGGGITPDIFIPLDTTRSPLAVELSYLGAYRSVSLDYYVRNRQAMQQEYPDLISFDTRFDADDALLTALLDFGREQDPELGEPSATDRAEMTARAKAYLAKHLFDESAYYYVLRHRDDDYQKALEVLRDYSTFFQASLAANRE